MRYYGTIALLLLLLLSCKKESTKETVDFGYNYQPKNLGHWVSYAVDSITYNDITDPSTITEVNYFIREELDTSFLDASGKENIRVVQYKKYNESDPWFVHHVGSFKISNDDFQRYNYDLRFLNLIFPVRESREWQGNIFLDIDNEPTLEYFDDTRYDWTYHYTEVDVSKTIGGFPLDSCLTVVQIDDENLFEKKYGEEVYARNIGLVSKELVVLNTQAPPSGATFLDRAESGFILRYTLKDFKN